MPVIHVPKTLRQQLGDQATDELVELLNRVLEDSKGEIIALVEEKFERRLSEELAITNRHITESRSTLEQRDVENRSALEQRIAETRIALEQQIAETKAELQAQIAEVKGELQAQIANVRADLIRWMFIFWVGQLAAMIGILYAFLR
jgi:hypothetical protein